MQSNTFESTTIQGAKIAIVRSRFNESVTQNMLDACIESLKQAGVQDNDLLVAEVPGAFEIPLAAHMLAKEAYDAVITIGCVIRGQTPHDRYISQSVIEKLQDLAIAHEKPVILGVITPLDQEQAIARSSGEHNKGVEAALSAVEMIQLRNSHN